MDLKAEVSYLKGLIEGAGENGKPDAVWAQVLAVLEGIADSVEEIARNQAELLEYVEALDEDLSVVESHFVASGGGEDDEEEEADLRTRDRRFKSVPEQLMAQTADNAPAPDS